MNLRDGEPGTKVLEGGHLKDLDLLRHRVIRVDVAKDFGPREVVTLDELDIREVKVVGV